MMVKKSDMYIDAICGVCSSQDVDPVWLVVILSLAGDYVMARREEKEADGIDMFGNGYDPIEELEAFQNKFFKK